MLLISHSKRLNHRLSFCMNMAGFGNSPDDEFVKSSDGPFEMSPQESKLDFSEDEEDLIARVYGLLGQRWALIAGRIPGRTAEEIEKYCRSKWSIIAGRIPRSTVEDIEKCCISTNSSSFSTD